MGNVSLALQVVVLRTAPSTTPERDSAVIHEDARIGSLIHDAGAGPSLTVVIMPCGNLRSSWTGFGEKGWQTMSRRRGALTLLGAVLVFAGPVSVPVPAPPRASADGAGDVAAFQAVVTRLKAGEPYYPVFGDELRRRGYPARSVFNWRTPLLLQTLAEVPGPVCRGVFVLVGICRLVATFKITAHESPWVALTNVMQAGAAMAVVAAGAEALRGVGRCLDWVICLHVCPAASGHGDWSWASRAVTAGARRALLCRMHTCCNGSATLAPRRRVAGRRLLYGAYFTWHIVKVRAHQLPTDVAQPFHWLNMRGVAALLEKAEWHPWLLPSPPWATALALTIVALGIVAVRAPFHARLATGVYIGFFMIAGQPFNGYWGLVAWPAWAMASGFGLQALVDAVRAIFRVPEHR